MQIFSADCTCAKLISIDSAKDNIVLNFLNTFLLLIYSVQCTVNRTLIQTVWCLFVQVRVTEQVGTQDQ